MGHTCLNHLNENPDEKSFSSGEISVYTECKECEKEYEIIYEDVGESIDLENHADDCTGGIEESVTEISFEGNQCRAYFSCSGCGEETYEREYEFNEMIPYEK